MFLSSYTKTSESLGEREMLWEHEPQASVSTAFSSCVSSSAEGAGAGPTGTAAYGESTRGPEVGAAVHEGVSSLTVQDTAQDVG